MKLSIIYFEELYFYANISYWRSRNKPFIKYLEVFDLFIDFTIMLEKNYKEYYKE